MTQWHMKGGTKISGGRRTTFRRSDKRLAWKGSDPTHTTIAQDDEGIQNQSVAGLGNTTKVKLRLGKYVLTTDGGKNKARKLEILSVVDNAADEQFARRNIITKGAVLKVNDGSSEGFVKVTSRPGQNGIISGIILKDFHKEREEKVKAKKESKKAKSPQKAHKPREKEEKK
ncbi:MAG TPA: hypothetical protein VJG83_01500 [archaeon]|nr:hypothetical protein [archaeon]